MSGEAEYGKCDFCSNVDILAREYYYYDVECDCCVGDKHFQYVRYCKNCKPLRPEKVFIKNNIS